MKHIKIMDEWDRLMDPKDLHGQLESYKTIADVAMQIISDAKHKEALKSVMPTICIK